MSNDLVIYPVDWYHPKKGPITDDVSVTSLGIIFPECLITFAPSKCTAYS